MPGAIIPDDWDEETYQCLKIQWPASVLWQAILFGQISEPQVDTYWDASSGDVQTAVLATMDAYINTVEQAELECPEENGGGQTVATGFKAYLSANQLLTAGQNNEIQFDTLEWSVNSPNFDVTDYRHKPGAAGLLGLWHYTWQMSFDGDRIYTLKALSNVSNTGLFYFAKNRAFNYSSPFRITDASEFVFAQVVPPDARTALSGVNNTWWSGVYLGEE